jgi:hypothetical protein
MQFNTKSTKVNANTKATKEYIFGVPARSIRAAFALTGIFFS